MFSHFSPLNYSFYFFHLYNFRQSQVLPLVSRQLSLATSNLNIFPSNPWMIMFVSPFFKHTLLPCTHIQGTVHCSHPELLKQSHSGLPLDAWAHNHNLLWHTDTPGVNLAQRDVQSLSDVLNRLVALRDDPHPFSDGLGCNRVVPCYHNYLFKDTRPHKFEM